MESVSHKRRKNSRPSEGMLCLSVHSFGNLPLSSSSPSHLTVLMLLCGHTPHFPTRKLLHSLKITGISFSWHLLWGNLYSQQHLLNIYTLLHLIYHDLTEKEWKPWFAFQQKKVQQKNKNKVKKSKKLVLWMRWCHNKNLKHVMLTLGSCSEQKPDSVNKEK